MIALNGVWILLHEFASRIQFPVYAEVLTERSCVVCFIYVLQINIPVMVLLFSLVSACFVEILESAYRVHYCFCLRVISVIAVMVFGGCCVWYCFWCCVCGPYLYYFDWFLILVFLCWLLAHFGLIFIVAMVLNIFHN